MAMPEEPDYQPCANCGDEWSETLETSGRPLCEECYNIWNCGCELCVRAAVKEGFEKGFEEAHRVSS